MSNFGPFIAVAVASTAFYMFYLYESKKKRESYNEQVIMARPNLVSTLTPRSDPYANSGTIRGSAPSIGNTAISQYPITEDEYTLTHNELEKQYNVNETHINQKNKNAPIEYFSEKIILSSVHNNKRMSMFNHIDPFELQSSEFSKIADVHHSERKPVSSRPDLSYSSAQLPKLGIDNKYKDPTDPSNYMYDRTLFAPLKRRNGSNGTDYIRGDVYVAPNKFGWFDVPSNPGTDLNPGFFNLNYPSMESSVERQDLKVERQNRGLTLADLENIQRNNPFSTNPQHRP
jgi:Family of unknown function (DUF5850)